MEAGVCEATFSLGGIVASFSVASPVPHGILAGPLLFSSLTVFFQIAPAIYVQPRQETIVNM